MEHRLAANIGTALCRTSPDQFGHASPAELCLTPNSAAGWRHNTDCST